MNVMYTFTYPISKQVELEKAQRRATRIITGLEQILCKERPRRRHSRLVSLEMTETYKMSGAELVNRQQLFTFSSNPVLQHQVKLMSFGTKKGGDFSCDMKASGTRHHKTSWTPEVHTSSKRDLVNTKIQSKLLNTKTPADQSWEGSKM